MSEAVIIIGAGVGGLALAQGLALNNIPFRIFERDPQLHGRRQGYRFRVSEEGIEALKQNLSPENFAKVERCCCADVPGSYGNSPQIHLDAITAQSSGTSLFKPGQPTPITATGKPWSVDRGALRSCLSLGLEAQLEYGKQLECYEEDENGVSVTFQDGTLARGRLLVGADGAWSKTRSLLLPSSPLLDTEGRLIYGKTEITNAFSAEFSSSAAAGMTFVRDAQQGLPCLLEYMRFDHEDEEAPHDYVYWVLFLRKDRFMPDKEMLHLSEAGVEAFVRKLTANWNPQLRCLFNDFAASLIPVTSSRPPLPSWNSNSRVTLIGDAAHVMAPTAAFGATSALQDADVLVQQLVHSGGSDDVAALRSYEGQMRQYAEAALHRSSMGGKMMFGMRPFDELPEVERNE
jgi:2-polyprenyl-6-methoxyphenol hydroxylase-like FAD-dependent oxidoreductase